MAARLDARKANAAMRKLPGLAKVEAQKSMVATAEKVARLAKGHAPRLTGLLEQSIQAKARKFGAVVGIGGVRDAVWVGETASARRYWKFVEYGSRRSTGSVMARPFMRPAALAVESEHDKTMRAHLEKANKQMERMAT